MNPISTQDRALDYRPLLGRAVRLDPTLEGDADELYDAIATPVVFAGGYGGGPAGRPENRSDFGDFVRNYVLGNGQNLGYTVRIVGGPADGRVVGSTSLGRIDSVNGNLHLGWTAYAPSVWRSAVNSETKRLILEHVFSSGYARVQIQADSRNERSRRAIERLGAQFEGVIRQDKLRADGTLRDTAVYSILSAEWPGIRSRLDERLAAGEYPVIPRSTDEPEATPPLG